MANPTDIRKNNVIMYNSTPHVVLGMSHVTQGRGRGCVQATLRNLSSGSSMVVKFRTSDTVEFCHTTNKSLEFSYIDGDTYHFIDPESFEDYSIPNTILGDDKKWLVEAHLYSILFVNGEPVSLDLPANIEIKVQDAPVGIRGDTSSAATKPVTLENGVVVQVPLFIKTGDILKIRTEDSSYISRA